MSELIEYSQASLAAFNAQQLLCNSWVANRFVVDKDIARNYHLIFVAFLIEDRNDDVTYAMRLASLQASVHETIAYFTQHEKRRHFSNETTKEQGEMKDLLDKCSAFCKASSIVDRAEKLCRQLLADDVFAQSIPQLSVTEAIKALTRKGYNLPSNGSKKVKL